MMFGQKKEDTEGQIEDSYPAWPALGWLQQPLGADMNTVWDSENQCGRFKPHLTCQPHTHCTSSYLGPFLRAPPVTHVNILQFNVKNTSVKTLKVWGQRPRIFSKEDVKLRRKVRILLYCSTPKLKIGF